MHGEELRIALLGEGEYFGEADLLNDTPSGVTVRSVTPSVFFTLQSSELEFPRSPEASKRSSPCMVR